MLSSVGFWCTSACLLLILDMGQLLPATTEAQSLLQRLLSWQLDS
jgi:hypothetical protein